MVLRRVVGDSSGLTAATAPAGCPAAGHGGIVASLGPALRTRRPHLVLPSAPRHGRDAHQRLVEHASCLLTGSPTQPAPSTRAPSAPPLHAPLPLPPPPPPPRSRSSHAPQATHLTPNTQHLRLDTPNLTPHASRLGLSGRVASRHRSDGATTACRACRRVAH